MQAGVQQPGDDSAARRQEHVDVVGDGRSLPLGQTGSATQPELLLQLLEQVCSSLPQPEGTPSPTGLARAMRSGFTSQATCSPTGEAAPVAPLICSHNLRIQSHALLSFCG